MLTAFSNHRIFCQNLNPGIAGKFWQSFYIYIWQSSLFKLTKKARLIVGSPRFMGKNPVLSICAPILIRHLPRLLDVVTFYKLLRRRRRRPAKIHSHLISSPVANLMKFTSVNYDSRVLLTRKLLIFTTLET